MGMDSTILTLDWSASPGSVDANSFETRARTLRYQALGRACRAHSITQIMVAHHADDQAESIMTRLARSRLRSGLQGMQGVQDIPECDGIFGVHCSGGRHISDPTLNIPFPVEKGGMQLVRPLLAFEKSRLIATCEDYGLKWAEDKTNVDQTLTLRNAIRHIYEHYQLPEALNIKSMIDVSVVMRERVNRHKRLAAKLFDECFIKLDIQTGRVLVRFPPFSSLSDHPIDSASYLHDARDNAYLLLERVALLVTPKSKTPLSQLSAVVGNIWPEFDEVENDSQNVRQKATEAGVPSRKNAGSAESSKKSFCVFGVWWQYREIQTQSFRGHKFGIRSSPPHPREWELTRQPLEKKESFSSVRYIPRDLPPRGEFFDDSGSPSELFDGRWWIRFQNNTLDTMVLRMFHQDDHCHIPTSEAEKRLIRNNAYLSDRPHRFIAAALDLIQPKRLRWTIPALFRIDRATCKEHLVGFPTLDVRMDGFGPPKGCHWRVRYKKVDLGSHLLRDIIQPGIERKDIEAEEERTQTSLSNMIKLKLQDESKVTPKEEFDGALVPRRRRKKVASKVERRSSFRMKTSTPMILSRKARLRSMSKTWTGDTDALSFLDRKESK